MLSRTITAATVLISVPGHLGLYSLIWVLFLKDYVFTIRQLPQIWRLVTAFFITGPQLGLIMDPFFLYHYSSQLETGSPRFSRPGAYAWYIFFVASVIMVSTSYPHPLHFLRFFPHNLVLSARTVFYNCHGSWKRGRSPLHCAASVIRKILKGVCGVWAWWDTTLRELSS